MDTIRCSIIIPAYDAAETIRECLNSLNLNMLTKDRIEVIVVDDGSIDDTLKIANEFSAMHSNIRAISKENGGVSSARNTGIRCAQGEYIFFMDSDDEIYYEVLLKMIRVADELCADAVAANYEVFDLDTNSRVTISLGLPCNQLLKRDYIEKRIIPDYYLATGLSSVCMMLYRRMTIEKHNILFNEHLIHGEDWDFNLRFFDACRSFCLLDDVLYMYKLHGHWDMHKYSAGLLYSFLHRQNKLEKLREKYSICELNSEEYIRFSYKCFCEMMELLENKSILRRLKTEFFCEKVPKQYLSMIINMPKEFCIELGICFLDRVTAFFLRHGFVYVGYYVHAVKTIRR